MSSTQITPNDPRLGRLTEELASICARPLRATFKQPEDEDEREKYPTLALVVKALVSEDDWRRSPIHQVTRAVRVAISKLPAQMSGRDVRKRIGNAMWKGQPERYFAEILYGERDREVASHFNVHNERLTYDDHYRPYVLEKAGFPTRGDSSSSKRMLRVIREDLALALLALKPEDCSCSAGWAARVRALSGSA